MSAAAPVELRSQARRLAPPSVLVLLVASILIPLALFGLAAWSEWQAVNNDARSRIEHVRDLLGEHALRIFRTHQLIATAVGDRVARMQPDAIAGSEDLHRFLKRVQTEFPEVHTIWLSDADGVVRASSRSFPVRTFSVADRETFKELRDRGQPYAIGSRYIGPDSSDEVFSMAFARRGEDGVFEGLIGVSVSPEQFRGFHEAAVATSEVAIWRRDGAVLARFPDDPTYPRWLGRESAPLARSERQASGTIQNDTTPDGIARLVAFGKVGDLPLFVSYGVASSEILHDWRARVASQAMYFLPATLILGALAAVAARGQRQLARLNARLGSLVDARTADLSRALGEKDHLLHEVHHRVKNNMQVISSLVGMQTRMGGSPEDTVRRIHAMSLVHELIYGSGDFEGLDLAHYVQRLSESLRDFAPPGVGFEFDLAPTGVALPQAVPVALIVNEVGMDALKQAEAAGASGAVRITLRNADGLVALTVAGPGRGSGALEKGGGFGLRLLSGLAAQLHGRYEFRDGPGSLFELTFPTAAAPPRPAAQPAPA